MSPKERLSNGVFMGTIPKVSVIIPTYNRKEYIAEAIDSVLHQTYRDFEIIVVDDGSTDGTEEMLKQKYGDAIRYFFKENGGCASARNFGIREARGTYVAFLDSDDRYMPNKLEDQVPLLDMNTSYGFIGADIVVQEKERSYVFRTVKPDRNGHIAYPLFIFTFFSLCAATFRRSCFDTAGYFDEGMRYNEDTDFLLRVAINFRSGFSPRPTLLYRAHEGGKSTDLVKLLQAVYDSSVNVVKRYPGFAARRTRVDDRLGQIRLDLALEYALRNDFTKGTEELALSRELYPTVRKRVYAFLFKSGLITDPFMQRIVLFEEKLRKVVRWYFYKYTGWIL